MMLDVEGLCLHSSVVTYSLAWPIAGVIAPRFFSLWVGVRVLGLFMRRLHPSRGRRLQSWSLHGYKAYFF